MLQYVVSFTSFGVPPEGLPAKARGADCLDTSCPTHHHAQMQHQNQEAVSQSIPCTFRNRDQKLLAVFTGPVVGPWRGWAEALFSRLILSSRESRKSSCSTCCRFFLPHNLQHTNAMPPINMAPPIPPTTPPITFLLEDERLLPLPPPLRRDGSTVAVA